MDEARLAEIEARLREVSPGPWRLGTFWDTTELERGEVWAAEPGGWTDGKLVTHHYAVVQPWTHFSGGAVSEDGDEDPHYEAQEWLCRTVGDAGFFAHAAEDVADLLAEVRRLREDA